MAGLTCCWIRICVVSVAIIMQLALLVEFVGAMLQFLADCAVDLQRLNHTVCVLSCQGVWIAGCLGSNNRLVT